jgi:hypothetical protein
VPDPQGPNGHTLFANSEVNGPCADALIQELVPAIESRYPLIREPSARLLRGHSSGGWAALWLTTQYPKIFGPCWAYAPDPVDFHHLERIDIYKQRNAYVDLDSTPLKQLATPSFHLHEAIKCTVRDENREEEIVGPRNTSALQWDSWQAVFGHRDAAGNPAPLFDAVTGAIDQREAEFYRAHDIVDLLRRDPKHYLPIFRDNAHVLVGADDSYYLAGATDSVRATIESLDPTGKGNGYMCVIPNADHMRILVTPEALAYPQEILSHLRRHGCISSDRK